MYVAYLIFGIVVSFHFLICTADKTYKELALEACHDAFAKFTPADWFDHDGHWTGRAAPKACADVAACTQTEVNTAVGQRFNSWSAGWLSQLQHTMQKPFKSGMQNCFEKTVACWSQFTSAAQLVADQLCQPKHEFAVNDPLTIKIRRVMVDNYKPVVQVPGRVY